MFTFLANNRIAGDTLLQLERYPLADHAFDQAVVWFDLLFEVRQWVQVRLRAGIILSDELLRRKDE